MGDEPRGDAPSQSNAADETGLPEPVRLPSWVPVLIGVMLVAIAALAVYTGWSRRSSPLEKKILSRSSTQARGLPESGAPGEPQPGASRVIHGNYGENIPAPGKAVTGESSRIAITGAGAAGITHVVRLTVRRGMIVAVVPDDAIVYVNDQPVGAAKQFGNEDAAYEFAEEGSYEVRVIAPGHRELHYVITSSSEAKDEMAVIRATLQPK